MTVFLNQVETICPVQGRRRKIDRRSGQALEILGHAIEYLTDDFVYEGASQGILNSRLEAVQLLMALNRQVYNECPEAPRWSERIHALFGWTAH
jgi:hypothetical protein